MSEEQYQAMQQAVAETLENMAFMEALPQRVGAPLEEDDLLVVSLLMHNPVQGEFRLIMTRNLLLQLAETLYSLPLEELESGVIEDTLAELLNTIAGQFLNLILPGSVYQLGLPEIESSTNIALGDDMIRWHFICNDEHFCLEFTGEKLPVDTAV